jgi:hypothetical protein
VGGQECNLDSDTRCSIEGVELRRPSGCINIAIQKGTAQRVPGLTDQDLERVILEAFDEWTSVDCGSGPPGIHVQSAGVVAVDDAFACNTAPTHNLDTWLVVDDLSPQQVVTPTTGAVAGTTFPRFVLETGEVFDADVKLNMLWLLIQDEDKLLDHLRTVAAHEAGHVLGLAHAKDEASLMYRDYRVTADRVPTDDDTQGICELFPPADLDCPRPTLEDAAFEQTACSRASQLGQQQQPPQPQPPAEEATGCSVSGCRIARPSALGRHAIWALFGIALLSLRRAPAARR